MINEIQAAMIREYMARLLAEDALYNAAFDNWLAGRRLDEPLDVGVVEAKVNFNDFLKEITQ